jgi:hypothetical protein
MDSVPANPIGYSSVLNGSAIGDFDGDGNVEIVFGSESFGLFVWEYDDSLRAERGWPAVLNGEVEGHPAVANVDASTSSLELVVADWSGRVHMFDLPDSGIATPTIEWGQFGNGPEHQGVHSSVEDYIPLRNPTLAPSLSLGHPNPFNPYIRFSVFLPSYQPVRISVYDVAGRFVRGLVDDVLAPGEHSLGWDGIDSRGKRVASGVYFVRLATDSRSMSRKVLLVR